MKKIRFIGENKFLFGLNELSKQLRFVLADDGYTVVAKKTDGDTLFVQTTETGARIEYPSDNAFFRGFSLALQHVGTPSDISVKLLIKNMGTMQDCSDGLMSVNGIKRFIRQSALMGYTYVGLYTETTYDIEGEPYFGYKSGKYSESELSEIVAYGERFEVEIIPFIQTLGHFAQLFRWSVYSDLHDIHNTLLVEYEKTYALIENMLKSLRKSYKTARINLGMDEAYFMGYGRYHWFINENNYDTASLFIGHLKRVLALAEKYGFTNPEIWFDNIFEIKYKGYINPPDWLFKGFEKEIRDNFPKVTLRFWHYAIRDEKEFDRCVQQIRQLSPIVSFASMARGYTSFAPENYKTAKLVETALNGCLHNGIDDIVITRWETVQSPCSMLPAFYDYIERCSVGKGYDRELRCKSLFGYTYQEFLMLDEPNKLLFDGQTDDGVGEKNLPFYVIAEDPLLGIMEKHIPQNVAEYYEHCAKKMATLAEKESPFNDIFEFEKTLCETVAKKGNLSYRIKKLYDAGDKGGLKKIADEMPIIAKQIKVFHDAYRKYWTTYNKRFGFELFDMRFGGVVARLCAVRTILIDYVEGKTDKIEELEEVRLPISINTENQVVSYKNWNGIVVGRLTRI